LLFPLPESVYDNRGEGNVTFARFRFGWSDLAPGIRPLPDVDETGFEIDIAPRQTAQFACAHTGENGGDD